VRNFPLFYIVKYYFSVDQMTSIVDPSFLSTVWNSSSERWSVKSTCSYV